MNNGTMKDQFENPDENVKCEKLKPSGTFFFFVIIPQKQALGGKNGQKGSFCLLVNRKFYYYALFCDVQRNATIIDDM